MGQAYIDRFFTEAERQMAERKPDVRPEDRRPVPVIPIQLLERALARANQQSFLETFALAQTVKVSLRIERIVLSLSETRWNRNVIHLVADAVNSIRRRLETLSPHLDKNVLSDAQESPIVATQRKKQA